MPSADFANLLTLGTVEWKHWDARNSDSEILLRANVCNLWCAPVCFYARLCCVSCMTNRFIPWLFRSCGQRQSYLTH